MTKQIWDNYNVILSKFVWEIQYTKNTRKANYPFTFPDIPKDQARSVKSQTYRLYIKGYKPSQVASSGLSFDAIVTSAYTDSRKR